MYLVYLFFNKDAELLYIGKSDNFFRRLAHHAYTQPWFPEVTDIKIEHGRDDISARRLEAALIVAGKPKYNKLVIAPNRIGASEEDRYRPPRGNGLNCPKCGAPKTDRRKAYCDPCLHAYRTARKPTRPVRTPSVTCPRCSGIKRPGPAYCAPCKRQVSKEARENKKRR